MVGLAFEGAAEGAGATFDLPSLDVLPEVFACAPSLESARREGISLGSGASHGLGMTGQAVPTAFPSRVSAPAFFFVHGLFFASKGLRCHLTFETVSALGTY